MEDQTTNLEDCTNCGGTGFLNSNYLTCKYCNGTGKSNTHEETGYQETRLDGILTIVFFAILGLFCLFCFYGVIYLFTLIPDDVNKIIKGIAGVILYGFFIVSFLILLIQRFFKKRS